MEALFQKGYCTVDLKLKPYLEKALGDVKELHELERFQPPPTEIVGGLLGSEGSSTICEIPISTDDSPIGGAGLQMVDNILTMVGEWLHPMDQEMGIKLDVRSFSVLHSAGEEDANDDVVPKLTEFECEKWLATFTKHRIMVVLFLGPQGGELELQPFNHEEAAAFEIRVEPGTLVLLRADALTHKFSPTATSTALSCFLCEAGMDGMHNEPVAVTPTAQELLDWASTRMRELKENQVIGEEGQQWDPEVPKEWQRLANHNFSVGQQSAIRGHACKFPSSYDPRAWQRGMMAGVDFGEQIPFLRWNHDEFYNAHEQSWKWRQSSCKHACWIDGADLFDQKFFGISVVESRAMDPMQRHILETSYEALHEAGFNKKRIMRSLIGCYIGAATSEFIYLPVTDSSAGTGGSSSITSNRISFCLGMQGPSYTIDTQGAASLNALHAAVMSLNLQTDRFEPNHTALFGSTYMVIAGQVFALASAQGLLSSQGRCQAFDAFADGYIKSEGIGNSVIQPFKDKKTDEVVDQHLDGIIAGSNLTHTGQTASLTSPNGPQEKELIMTTIRVAGIAPDNVDAVECMGQGFILLDAVEAMVIKDVYRGPDPESSLVLGACKTHVGNMMESGGMCSYFRALFGQKWGVAAPNLHLHELNYHIDAWSGEGDEPLLFTTENVTYKDLSSFVALTAKSFTGIMGHAILHAFVETEQRVQRTKVDKKPIMFWPGGGGELDEDQQPTTNRPYSIRGSWSDWEAQDMKKEEDGVYAATVTLGDELCEEFQILLDGKYNKVLHPNAPFAAKGTSVQGPDSGEQSAGLTWLIDGRSSGLPTLVDTDKLKGTDAMKALGFKEDEVTKDVEVGTKYKVRLRVAGKWRSVDWEKM